MALWKNLPNEDTPINAENLSRSERYLQATAGANGDFFVNINGASGLAANDIVRISFPAATNSASNARLSIDGGTTYYNITNSQQLKAAGVQNLRGLFVYNGTDFIVKEIDEIVHIQTITPNNQITLNSVIGKNEVLAYYSGSFNERAMMIYNKDLSNNSVWFMTSIADGTNLKKFGLLVDFTTGVVRNDNLSSVNITKIIIR